jgi:hypothetical protein
VSGDLQDPGLDETDAGTDAPPRPRAADMDELRERLKARGLVTDAVPVVIPKAPRPAAPEPTDAPGADGAAEDGEAHWAESPYDSWDVEPGPETTDVACPRCREIVTVPVEATRLTCATCDRTWRYVVCDHCDHLDLTVERQESWRCLRCGTFSRSWWRTPSARLLAIKVTTRRRDAIVQEQRRLVREGMRLRRWKLIAFAVCAALAAAVFVVATRAAEPDVASGTDAACSHFRRILEDVSAGRMDTRTLDAELVTLQREAEGGPPQLGSAVTDMRAASGATSPEFITARATFVDACGPAFRTSP